MTTLTAALWMALACTGEGLEAPGEAPSASSTPADPALAEAVRAALRFPGEPPPLAPRWEPSVALRASGRGWTAQVGSYEVRAGFRAAALLMLPDRPWTEAVVVAHGHYGEGKNSAEAQDIAHALAAGGVAALVVDSPGVEEWDLPGRRIHLAEGAHGRGLLIAGGSSALALQVELLRRGVELLEGLGARRVAATGASGGAVQAFWLGVVDPRITGVILASFPQIPRAPSADGCLCDLLPGPGLDRRAPAETLALLERPSLWMSELEVPPPAGLPAKARYEVMAGPHSYTAPMIARALAWLRESLGFGVEMVTLDPPPHVELHTGGPAEGAFVGLGGLPLRPERTWTPRARPGPPSTLRCQGTGPTVLVVGEAAGRGPEEALSALGAVGLRACRLEVEAEDPDTPVLELSRGEVYAERLGGTLREAAGRKGAVGVWARRAWALPAAAAGLPFVVEQPVLTLEDLREDIDPEWIHVPGWWWGGAQTLIGGALATGEDPSALARALADRLRSGSNIPEPGAR